MVMPSGFVLGLKRAPFHFFLPLEGGGPEEGVEFHPPRTPPLKGGGS